MKSILTMFNMYNYYSLYILINDTVYSLLYTYYNIIMYHYNVSIIIIKNY